MPVAIKPVKGKGPKEAAALVEALRKAVGSDVTGIALLGRPYPDNPNITTADVMEYLAEPKHGPKRDLRPTEKEAEAAAKIFMVEHARRLRRMKGRTKIWTAKEGDAVQSGALRKAGKYVRDKQSEWIEAYMQNDGSQAPPPTSEEYALWRERKYGISPYEVYERTGLLLTTIQKGPLKLQRGFGAADFL